MLPAYPSMTSKDAPYPYQSTRQDPRNTNTCKPVAIISHDSELTLITCSQTNFIKDNQFICQHQKLLSNISGIPRAALIQDLQKRSCCVYTVSQDGASLQEQVVEHEANVSPLAELKPEDFAGLMETNNEQVNQSTPADLGLHKIDEEAMQRLLSSEALSGELNFSQQGASTSSASLNQGASTSRQAPAATALLNQPPSRLALNQEKITQLSSLILSEKRVIYCVLEALENSRGKPFTRWQLIDAMKEKYINFDQVQSAASHNRAFSCAIKFDLIQKSIDPTKPSDVIYTLGQYGSAAFQYLKQEILPFLSLRSPPVSH